MPRITGQTEDGVQAVILTLKIIEQVVSDRRSVGISELANALRTTKSRIHRHLQTLVARGYLSQQPETDRYQIGRSLLRLAHTIDVNVDFIDIAGPALRGLRDALGHYTVLSVPEDDGVRVQSAISGKSVIEIGVRRGSLLPFHASAQGKIALAFGSDTLRRSILSSKLEMFTPHTVVSLASLEHQIASIRQQRWAIAPNEVLIGLNALAAPVFDAAGNLVASVAIVDSIQFLQNVPSEAQIRETLRAADTISDQLGWRGPSASAGGSTASGT